MNAGSLGAEGGGAADSGGVLTPAIGPWRRRCSSSASEVTSTVRSIVVPVMPVVDGAHRHDRGQRGDGRDIREQRGIRSRGDDRGAELVPDAARPREPLGGLAERGGKRVDDRFEFDKYVDQFVEPAFDRLDAGAVGRVRFDRPGDGAEPSGECTREVPEHVVLAREVLVERRARAARDLGDQFDTRRVEAVLAEHLERRVEDRPMGRGAAAADVRAVAVGLPPHHLHGARVTLGSRESPLSAEATSTRAGSSNEDSDG